MPASCRWGFDMVSWRDGDDCWRDDQTLLLRAVLADMSSGNVLSRCVLFAGGGEKSYFGMQGWYSRI